MWLDVIDHVCGRVQPAENPLPGRGARTPEVLAAAPKRFLDQITATDAPNAAGGDMIKRAATSSNDLVR